MTSAFRKLSMKAASLALLAVSLASCSNRPPPHWSNVLIDRLACGSTTSELTMLSKELGLEIEDQRKGGRGMALFEKGRLPVSNFYFDETGGLYVMDRWWSSTISLISMDRSELYYPCIDQIFYFEGLTTEEYDKVREVYG